MCFAGFETAKKPKETAKKNETNQEPKTWKLKRRKEWKRGNLGNRR
jgi:hypothetical protein